MPLMNGLEAIHRIRRAMPSMRIVCISSNSDDDTIRECFQKGASGFIPKTASGAELVLGLRRVLHGDIYLSQRLPQSAKLFSDSVASHRGRGGPAHGAADRSLAVARRRQDDERGCCCAQPDHTYRCVPQIQADEHAEPEHERSGRAVRPSASSRLCLSRQQCGLANRRANASGKPTVRHNSSSRETIVGTLAVLRVFYVQESHARRVPSASCRTALERGMQEQFFSPGTGITTCRHRRRLHRPIPPHLPDRPLPSSSSSAAPASTAQPAPTALLRSPGPPAAPPANVATNAPPSRCSTSPLLHRRRRLSLFRPAQCFTSGSCNQSAPRLARKASASTRLFLPPLS